MNYKTSFFRRFLLAILMTGCWNSNLVSGPFDVGPQGESATEEFTHNDMFDFDDAQSDSLDTDNSFGGASDGSGYEGEENNSEEEIDEGVTFTGPQQQQGGAFISSGHIHQTNFYEPHVIKDEDEDEGIDDQPEHHPVSYYDKAKPKVSP